MNGAEFRRRVKRYADKAGLTLRFDPGKGKGSHGILFLGTKRTTVKRSEIGKRLLGSMLKDLGIKKEEF